MTLQNGMLLNCTCPWTGKLVMVTWTKGVNSSPLAVYHPDYGVNFNSAYDGRVEFINTSAMDGSIRVTNVTEEDEGVYQCSMQTFPQGSWSKETLVKKQGITNENHHHLATVIGYLILFLLVLVFTIKVQYYNNHFVFQKKSDLQIFLIIYHHSCLIKLF